MLNFLKWFSLIYIVSSEAKASVIMSNKFSWLPLLTKSSVNAFHVCGNSDIMPNADSISRNFILGPEKDGYLFSSMLSVNDFNNMLKKLNREVAKQTIENAFKKSILWKYSEKNGLENLGIPVSIDLPFTYSIKDCIEGSPTNYGHQCSSKDLVSIQNCCSTKFPSPKLFWGDQHQYTLIYDPGNGIRLKIPNEKKHRFCNIYDLIQIK